MGKRIIARRRGRGGRYRSFSFRFKTQVKHRDYKDDIMGKVLNIIHCPGHTSPLAEVLYDDGIKTFIIAPEGIAVGDRIGCGKKINLTNGSLSTLGSIPEGSLIYNIEGVPGDGGMYVKSAGTSARVVSKSADTVVVTLPSKKQKEFSSECRAMIGVAAGSGRSEKPFVRAGKKWFAMRARGRLYPKTAAVAMNAVDHPFGSGRGRHMGKPSVPPRNAPAGRKVGQIKARRTGWKR